jgi:hypothetical protein
MDFASLLDMLKQDPSLVQQVAGGGGGVPPPLPIVPDGGGGGPAVAPAPAPAPVSSPAPVVPPPAPVAPAGAPIAGQGDGTAAPPAAGPPDMSALYTKLINQATRKSQIDDVIKGGALIAAGFAQEKNRPALIQAAFSNDGSSGGSGGISTQLETLRKLQEDAQKKQVRAGQIARLPAIAKKYNLDMATVNYLFETGKLDDTINQLAQPQNEVVTTDEGSRVLVDKRTGKKVADISAPSETKDIQIIDDPETGEKIEIKKGDPSYRRVVTKGDPTRGLETFTDPKSGDLIERKKGTNETRVVAKGDPTKNLVSEKTWDGSIIQYDKTDPTNPEKTKIIREGDTKHGWTTDQKHLDDINAQRKLDSKPLQTMEEFLKEKDARQSQRQDPVGVEFGKTLVDEYKVASGSRQTVAQTANALEILHRPGGILAGSMAAQPSLEARKILAQTFGFSDETANNTDSYKAAISALVLPRVKQLGSGSSISNADRDFVMKMLGGSGEVSASVAKEILIRMERLELDTAMEYNRKIDAFKKNNPNTQVMNVELPKLSQHSLPQEAIDWVKKNPDKIADFDARIKVPGLGRAIVEGRYGG